jgi:hypothetical protein
MKDTLLQLMPPPQSQKIRVQTPIGSIETMDDNPIIDVLIIVLIFSAFCIYVYAKYLKK